MKLPGRLRNKETYPEPRDITGLVRAWCARTRAVEEAHFNRCVSFRSRHFRLGALTIVLSTLMSVLSHEEIRHHSPIGGGSTDVIALFLSVIVPVLTALVAFLRFDERSALHHNAAAKFAALKRRLQMHYIERFSGESAAANDLQVLSDVCKQWNELTIQAPALYKRDWSKRASHEEELIGLQEDILPARNDRQNQVLSAKVRSLELQPVAS